MGLISKKNQITIPVKALADAGLRPGDEVEVIVVAPGRIELIRVDELVAQFAGVLDDASYPPGYLEELRNEWR